MENLLITAAASQGAAPSQNAPSPVQEKAIVFVHGIFSDHGTFDALEKGIRRTVSFNAWRFYYFDYNFHQSIADSGLGLADALQARFDNANCEVTIVGHSMGGLVGRVALLERGDGLSYVKRLIMLGTPNHGTLHTARLGLLAHLAREATGKIWSVFSRKTGIKELSEIGRCMGVHLNDTNLQRAKRVEYVTIPAYFYHEEASWLRLRPRGNSLGLRALNLGFEFTKAWPFSEVGLERPHDGIVEESSVFLGTRVSSRFSERSATCDGEPDCGPYLHVRHQDFKDEDHVTVQRAERTIQILTELLQAESVEHWRRSTAGRAGYGFEPAPSAAARKVTT